jgi:MFS family permease
MTQTIQRKLNDSAFARWAAVILISLMMFFAYMFVDMMSPLQSLIEGQRGWSPDVFGAYGSSEYLLNVFGFLIIAGIILDKMGIRFTGTLSASLMVIGAVIKFYAVSDWFAGSELDATLTSWQFMDLPGTALLACLGFMIFGCGCEMAGITVSRAIAKWFKGKEMAMAMGLEMAIARIGVFAIFTMSPAVANSEMFAFIPTSVVKPVFLCTVLLIVGLLCFLVFNIMDKKFDKQLAAAGEAEEVASDEEFKIGDVKVILSSKIFWLVALLCVLYYSAIFPFQKYAVNMFENNLNLTAEEAASIFRWFPIGAALITPFLGGFLDKRGKGATMLILGAILMISCHLVFALVLPKFPNLLLAYAAIVVLGVSFSLVPAALWPSVPKLMPERYLGSAYSLIFWVQNVGLCLVPYIIGIVLNSTNPGVSDAFQNKNEIATLQAKVEYIDNIKAHEANIALYNELQAAEAVVAEAEVAEVAENTEATEVAEVAVAPEQEVVPTLPEGFDIAKCQAELKKLNNEKAAQGISKDFNYEIAVAELEALKVEKAEKNYPENPRYDYTATMLLFVSFGVLALLFGFWLKIEDKRKGYGLELPNIKE